MTIDTQAIKNTETVKNPVDESDREFVLLEHIETDPDVTQASLAAQLGVSVGTINWLLKRLISKGYVKVKRAQRRKLRYIITPEGLAFRAHLTVNYIETSLRLYRKTRQHVRDLLAEVKQAGQERVQITGEGDISDICRLTCLEQGISIAEGPANGREPTDSGELIGQQEIASPDSATSPLLPGIPVLEVNGTKVFLRMQP